MKKKISIILAAILSVLTIFSSFPAFALTEGNSYAFEKEYLNAYYDTGEWQTADGNYHDNYGQVSLYTLKSTGEPVYCLQIYNETAGSSVTAKSIEDTDLWRNELTAIARQIITRVSIWGYPNNNYGYSNRNAQLATQVLIWEAETGARTNYSTGCTSWAKSIFNNYPDALKCYNEILEACQNHATRPSFYGTTVTLKNAGEANAVTLKDGNGVLNQFTVTSTNSKIKTSVSGNNLKIWCTDSSNYNGTISFVKKNTDLNTVFALTGANQVMFYGTLADPVQARVTVNVEAEKKFRISVTKKDSENVAAQGEATLAGAVYGIYKAGDLIDTYTTDENGQFTTAYYLCGDDWTLKEIFPSEGYLLDETEYKINASEDLFTVEYNTISLDVFEEVLKGYVAIIKHTDDGSTQIETPEVGAEFQVYLKSSGSYENADDLVRDTLICDEYGFAQSKDLPYGLYTIHQSKGWDGRELIDDFDVYISKDSNVYRFIINNANFKSYLKIVKIDAETGKAIPYAGAGFKLFDPAGEPIVQKFSYPAPTTIDVFYTNEDGYLITPETLPYGLGYSLVEVEAPYGYVLDSAPIYFDVTQENSTEEGTLTVVTVERPNLAQKGVIEITKTGEVFSTVANSNDIYTPIFENQPLVGATFEVYAYEDIVTPEGTIRVEEGTLVDTITTGEDGIAKTDDLYLGKYLVKEIAAPDTFVLSSDEYIVELAYAGQEVSVTSTSLRISNERQKVEISLNKALEKDDLCGIGKNGEILAVQFGVFADEDIYAADGSFIPKDSLVSTANCNADGTLTFTCDLPLGFSWYVKEIATDEHYILSNDKYEFNTEYQGQDIEMIRIEINDGEPIVNELKKGKLVILKVDAEDHNKVLEDVVIVIEDENGKVVAKLTTDKDGIAEIELPYGKYVWYEKSTIRGYKVDREKHEIEINEDGQIIKVTFENTPSTPNSPNTGYYAETASIFRDFGTAAVILISGMILSLLKRKRRNEQ